MSVHEREEPAPTSEREELAKIISKSMGGHLGITRELAYELADAILAQGFSGRSPAEVPPTDTERLNWLERFILDNKTDGHLFCYAGDLTCPTDECYLEVDGEAVGQAPTIREAIDAAMQSAGRVEERPTT